MTVNRSPLKVLGAATMVLALSGCSVDDFLRMGMPAPATKEAPIIESLWVNSWLAAWLVGALVWGLLIYAVIKFRRKPDDGIPEQVKYNMPIEILYTVAPLLMILVMAVFTWRDQAELTDLTDRPTHTVGVVGFRWSWTFNYVGEGVYDIGTPAKRPTLWLPVNETVRFDLTSPDVIHSFWVPAFLNKMDVIPGRMNRFEATPNKIGTYSGKCAELCGADHARMLFDVKVVSRADYDAHIQALRDAGQVGSLNTGRVSTKAGVTQ